MKSLPVLLLFLLFFSSAAGAATLPGFRVEPLGTTSGFASSIAIDSHGTIYYTTTVGDLYRFDGGVSTKLAHVNTEYVGNSGLLGMALVNDRVAVVHYVTPKQTADVISLIDLDSGSERVLQTFIADITFPGRSSAPEHHGGNPTVAADGSIFVAIGDYGVGAIAAKPEWNAGKVWRIAPDGSATQFARGFRNPFDLVWDPVRQRIVMTDNGALIEDEINLVYEGFDYGWPFTAGNQPPIEGTMPPVYTFPSIVAPTGMIALNGRNAALPRGYLIGAFVTKAIYYVADVDAKPLPPPVTVMNGEAGFIIDVAQAANGDILFVSDSAIYRLITPARGDCNGDGLVDARDFGALAQELLDGNPQPVATAHLGTYRGSFGCDVNGDGSVDTSDVAALAGVLRVRARSVRTR